MFHQPDLFDPQRSDAALLDLPALIERIALVSKRPRYAFLVLTLIAKAAGARDSVGPYVREGSQNVPVRDWLSEALIPLAHRDGRRRAVVEQVRAALLAADQLPGDEEEAQRLVDRALRARLLRSGRCNISRAVSDLVRAGLLRRHYQGYRVDHENRGAQREAVYTLTVDAQWALGRTPAIPCP